MSSKQQAHAEKKEGTKKSKILRNILVVILFVLVSMGTSVSAHDYVFSNFVGNTFISVALSILCGVGFSYFFMTVITNTKLIKK